EHGLVSVELWLLGQEAGRHALAEERLADEILILAGHDAQQRALARAVEPQHADLGAVEERQPDALEDLALGRDHFAEVLHRVNEFGCHGGTPLDGTQRGRQRSGGVEKWDRTCRTLPGGASGPGNALFR